MGERRTAGQQSTTKRFCCNMKTLTFALNRLILLLLTSASVVATESTIDTSIAGAEYLHSAISDIKSKISEPVTSIDWIYGNKKTKRQPRPPRISVPPIDTDRSSQYIPQPSLTKGELIALYDAALSNGGGGIVPATLPPEHHDETPGYYYYYYPLNTEDTTTHGLTQAQLHLHDVKIHTLDDSGGGSGVHSGGGAISGFIHNLQHGRYKALEPLFMAVSSFVGMAMMFFFSMIFMPRFGHHKSRSDVPIRPQPTSLSEVVLKAIDGQDCDERLFCEAGRVLRAFNLEDNRFVRFLQRIAPGTFSKGIEKARRMASYNRKCIVIQCKKKKFNKNNKQPIRSRILPQPQRKNQKSNPNKNQPNKNQPSNKKPRRVYNNT